MKEYIKLTYNEIKQLREKLFDENDVCPICKNKMTKDNIALDHQHKEYKEQEIGENGAGLVRGVLDFQCNSWEGKVTNSFKRLGLHKKTDIVTALRGLADYLEQDNLNYIHPREADKPKKLKKSSYNKLMKVSTLVVPKYTGNYTKQLEKLFSRYMIDPEFYL